MADETGAPPPPATPRRLIGELRVTSGRDAGRMIAVRDDAVIGRIAFGRIDTPEIMLADDSGELSRRHARIIAHDGEAIVEDLGSANGTFVNGERVHGQRILRAGDEIRIGRSTLEFAPALQTQFTRPPEVPRKLRRTEARDAASHRTPVPDVPSDITYAREIPTDTTHIREVVEDFTRAREAPPEFTAVRQMAPAATASVAPPPPSAPVTHEPTYAPPNADGELQILSGPGTGAAAAVIGSATIGREPENDLQVLDSEVSRRHAKVTIRDHVAAIDDLRSANGTYVNGERILERRTLAPGDRIEIGEATIELTSPAFSGAVAHTPPPQVSGVRDVIVQSPELLTAESGTRKWWTLGVVLITVFMLLLDVTIVAVALPSISAALHPGFSALQWIVDAYTLTLTAVLLTAGSFADIFGRKRVLSIGLIIFTVASVACAQAPDAVFLDFARGVQGIGAATMFACSLALIVQEFPAGERGLAFGLYGAVNGVSVALGPIIGGVLVETIGWQAIFYLNVPVAIVAGVILQRKVVNLPGPPTKIDWLGLATFSAGMFLAIYATIRGNSAGWTSTLILSCFGAAILLFAAFVAIELRRKYPMFDLSLFRNPTFIGSSVSAITVNIGMLALIFFLTTWFQSILGYSAVGTGARMLVFSGVALLGGPLGGRLSGGGIVSPRVTLPVALLLISAGVLSMTSVTATSSWTAIIPGLCLAGFGVGLINPTLASTAVSVVPPWRGGMASGMNSTCREAGMTIGIAVLGTVLAHQVAVHVNSSLAGSPLAGITGTVSNAIAVGGTRELVAGSPAAFRPGLLTTAQEAYTAGLRHIFVIAAIAAAAGAVIAAALVRKRHMKYAGEGGH